MGPCKFMCLFLLMVFLASFICFWNWTCYIFSCVNWWFLFCCFIAFSYVSLFYSVYMWFINLKSILKVTLMHLKKKKKITTCGLKPEARCSMWTGQNRTGPHPEDALHITDTGALPTQLISKGKKGVLTNKVSVVIVQQISVRWLEKRSPL